MSEGVDRQGECNRHERMHDQVGKDTVERVERELALIRTWTQRALIQEGVLPGPESHAFQLDDVFEHLAGETCTNNRATAIFMAAIKVHRMWSSREGARELAIADLEQCITATRQAAERLRAPSLRSYAISVGTASANALAFNDEPAVATACLGDLIESARSISMEDALAVYQSVLDELIKRRPRHCKDGIKDFRNFCAVSYFCYELHKPEEERLARESAASQFSRWWSFKLKPADINRSLLSCREIAKLIHDPKERWDERMVDAMEKRVGDVKKKARG